MEIALVDCRDESLFNKDFPSSFQLLLFCIPRGVFSPPSDCPQLRSFDFTTSQSNQLRNFLFVKDDFELGFVLGRLCPHRVTFYTPRTDLALYQTIKVKVEVIESLQTRSEETALGPATSADWVDDTMDQFMRQLEEKYRSSFLMNPLTRATKKTSALAQMRNIADGIRISHASKYPQLVGSLPGSEEMAERLYEELKRRGIIAERLGQVNYYVEGAPQAAKLPISAPNSKKLAYNLKMETLHKYIEKFMLQSSIRAIKEKSARAQLMNLAKGAVIAAKTKFGPNIDIGTEEQISSEMFGKLIQMGAIAVDGLNAIYDDEKIAEIAGDVQVQEEICEEATLVESIPTPVEGGGDLKRTILKEAFMKYYQKFLTNVSSAAKTAKGVKEQIKNFVQGSVTSAGKSIADIYSFLPTVEDLTETLYKTLITRNVIVTVGHAVRYSPEAIEALEQDMSDLAWEEPASPTISVLMLERLTSKLTQQCMESPKLTLQDMFEIAKRCTHAEMRFNVTGSSPGNSVTLAKEVMKAAFKENDYLRLSDATADVDEVVENLEQYAVLTVEIQRKQKEETNSEDA